jgi:hypothetical protein
LKGDCYGTLLVDLQTHCPVEVLPDREAATVVRWLRAHLGMLLKPCADHLHGLFRQQIQRLSCFEFTNQHAIATYEVWASRVIEAGVQEILN